MEFAHLLDRADQWRGVEDDTAVDYAGLLGQSLDGGVAVELDVLAGPIEQLQQPVHHLVLADALNSQIGHNPA